MIRLGLFGFGVWARKALARNLAKHTTIAWVCDTSEEARHAAMDAGYRAVTEPDWGECDAVAIATPIATHVEMTLAALQAGKHVLCEKPLATRRDAAEMLRSEARKRGLVLMTDHVWTAHPAVIRGAEVARDLGEPLWFRSTRTSWDERALDPLDDLLAHDLTIMRTWGCGTVVKIAVMGPDHSPVVSAMTNKGVVASLTYSYRDAWAERDVAMGCAAGAIGVKRAILRVVERNKTYETPCGGPEPLDVIAAEFARCCESDDGSAFGGPDDAVYVAGVIEAARLARARQTTVYL